MPYIGKSPTAVPLSASDLNDDIVSLAKLASGTDGNLITYDASGNPAAVATGDDGQVLTSAGAGAAPAFEAASGGDYVKLESGTVSPSSSTVVIGEGYFTSTYENYFVYLTNFVPSTNGAVRIRFNSGGSALTGSEYQSMIIQGTTATGGTDALEDQNDFGATSIRFAGDPAIGGDTTMGFCAQIWLPAMAQTSPAINPMFYASGRSGGIDAVSMRNFTTTGTYDATGAISGITIFPNSGTLDAGEWVVYGLKS